MQERVGMWDGGSIDCSLRERALPRDGVTVRRRDPVVPRVGYLSLHPLPCLVRQDGIQSEPGWR